MSAPEPKPARARVTRRPVEWEDDIDEAAAHGEAPEGQRILGGDLPLAERIALLPTAPGCYLMVDAKGSVIYVGKAKNLRARVRSYFREGGDVTRPFVGFLVRRVDDVQFIVTDTEKEALLLENTLIKKHKPRYNIELKDDKTFLSLRLDTTAEWPRLQRIRRPRRGDRARIFGPYASAGSLKQTLRFLQRIFPLRSCPDHVLRNRSRPCILHQIGRCCAPCVGLADRHEYKVFVENTILFLEGRRDEVTALLHRKMEEFSDAMEFERAAAVRDQLRALQRTVETERVATHRAFDRDVVALNRAAGRMVVTVLQYRGGNLEGTRHFDFADTGQDDGEVLDSFLAQAYEGARLVPRDVLTSHAPESRELLESVLAEARGGPVRVMAPERGEKRRLVELALTNGAQMLGRVLAGEKTRESVLSGLQSALGLPRPPHRVECFDISNFQGAFVVGAMTCLIDGEPARGEYRLFRVKGVAGQDDFASMREVLTRRYRRVIGEGGPLPDLIVIDGGKGQLAVACVVLEELGLIGRVPVVGLAKARLKGTSKGVRLPVRTEERVFLPGRKNPVVLGRANPGLHLLMRVRDEAHRFGVSYHRRLRGKSSLMTGLEGIAGLGEKRRKDLLRHFGSLLRVREASVEQLGEVLPALLAARVWEVLHRPAPEQEPVVEEVEVDGDGDGPPIESDAEE
jgi:excinuclease ABC subunit C